MFSLCMPTGLVMLQALQLYSCEITDPGAAAIGAAAASMPCLRCYARLPICLLPKSHNNTLQLGTGMSRKRLLAV